VLPESNGYPGSQTARSYLSYFGELFGMDRREAARQADRRLAQLGLADRQERIATFSRGMRQRLGLARTLLHRPPVLFLDEPTLGLDPAGQQELLAHLTSAAVEEGACVVLCSHQLDEVERICDRVAIMHHGRVVADGGVDELIAASGVAAACTVRVPWADVGAARGLLTSSPLVATVQSENTRPGELTVELAAGPGEDDDRRTELLRLLLDAGIAPFSFDLQGARLSDAFVHLTRDWR
jgi:ABC-2 type transport system ATP-binding protein